MKVAFRPEAGAELLAAKAWYEQRSPGLGFEFARAVASWSSLTINSRFL